MGIAGTLQTSGGSFRFLHPDDVEVQRLLDRYGLDIPVPQPVFLEGEVATGLAGYLVLASPGLRELQRSLHRAIRELSGPSATDSGRTGPATRRYRDQLHAACENVTASDYGRHFPAVFWLHHSRAIATALDLLSAELDPAVSRCDLLEALVPHLEQVVDEVRRRLEPEAEGPASLDPALFRCIVENRLALLHSSLDDDFAELDEFIGARYGIDGELFRLRRSRLLTWHEELPAIDSTVAPLERLLGRLVGSSSRERLLSTPGYVTLLAERPDFRAAGLWSPSEVRAWEDLLPRLKVWELIANLRCLTLEVNRDGDSLHCGAGELLSSLQEGGRALALSPTLRPLDFSSPWVVDPGVSRCGLVYDVVHFTKLVSGVSGARAEEEEAVFRSFFRFQRRLDGIAEQHRLYREKYLGDGVFYTGRDARRLLVAAIRMQRAYREVLADGFPFDRGLRLALNHGRYRLLPFGGPRERAGERYEIFGEAVVELFRLLSGKSDQDLGALSDRLVAQGYDRSEVDRFFGPLLVATEPLADGPWPPFAVTVTASGRLVNCGIVATVAVLDDLIRFNELGRLQELRVGAQDFVAFGLTDAGRAIELAVRPLGRADLKGLESPALIEIVDRELLVEVETRESAETDLLAALARISPAAIA
jgi:class 3 adenylate cyclase